MPPVVIGLTVVAYGTSAPEVIVGLQAARSGHGAVALGDVIGSNIANIGLILALCALVRPARVHGDLRRRELPTLALTALAVTASGGSTPVQHRVDHGRALEVDPK